MINGDRGEGNLDDDYDIIDGVDAPMDDIVSLEDDEIPKKPEHEEEPKKQEPPAQSQETKQRAPEAEVPLRSIPESYRKELRNRFLDRGHLRAKIKERMQLNGFYNIKKIGKDNVIQSVNETERIIHEVMKI
jgi:hypothetical protein